MEDTVGGIQRKGSHHLGFGSWKSEETRGRWTVSLTHLSHPSLGNYTDVELRLHIPVFVSFTPGTLEVDHKVVKSVSVRLCDAEVKQFERSHSISLL